MIFFSKLHSYHVLLPCAHLFLFLSLPHPKSSDAMEAGQDLVAGGLGPDHSTVPH